MDEWELIEAYAKQQSESAFRTLVERHAGLVYASALRQIGNPQLAQDISQAVFILLARRAGGLPRGTVLSGWLFQTTRFLAYRAIRTEQRRQAHPSESIELAPASGCPLGSSIGPQSSPSDLPKHMARCCLNSSRHGNYTRRGF
jgi:DNA-directed RNA polymerase specialized sigma24 family protein